MSRRFAPAGPLRGTLRAPGDPSLSQLAALVGAMCADPVHVTGYLETRAALEALRALGALVEEGAPGTLTIRGPGLRAALEADVDLGGAGTLLRILPGWLAGQRGGVWRLDGDAALRRAPVDGIAAPLAAMGARIDGRRPPLTVHGASLAGIEYALPTASAAVKSCVLLAGLTATGRTAAIEPAPSPDHTERLLARAGAGIARDGARIELTAQDELELGSVHVPGDPSATAFLVAAAVLVKGSRIVVSDMNANWTRTGFFRIAQRMGAIVLGDLEPVRAGEIPAEEPACELDVAAGPLVGTVVEAAEAGDALPLVALLACHAEGETVVRGAPHAALVGALRGLGAGIEATADGFVVSGAGGLRGGVLADPRLARLGAVAGLASREGVVVKGPDAAFERDLAALLSRAQR